MAMATSPTPQPPYSFGVPWPELNEGLSYADAVPSIHPAPTLIGFYSTEYKSSAPLEGWLQRIRNGQITIDGQVVTDPETVLRAGSKVVYHRFPWKEPPAPYLLEVLYEDDHMVAINKPSGLQVLPGGLFQQRTVLQQLKWNTWKGIPVSHRCVEAHPVPVHRLGRGTSGILLCAKTKPAKTCLAKLFAVGTSAIEEKRKFNQKLDKDRRISKFYRALVTGLLEDDEVLIKQPIGVMQYPGVAKGLYIATSSGKPALSKVSVVERDVLENRTLVQVEIHSGRPHQIRIHLAYIGHPLFGDPLYDIGGHPKSVESELVDGSFAEDGGYNKPTNPVPGDCGYFLHAHRVILFHPSTDEVVEITAPLPSVLQTSKELNRKEIPKEGLQCVAGSSS
ncbi:tRNA pseudouridine(32) synthase protein [Dioscorea alata]|uniref:tRNA pseudouridine(32) synthase protein n=2 Tax=Dioscorea alata TaxID=55571 RepID=A0ACB7V2Z9_DIOAL|nr:tRNA pseudouridine(32) synthase protein [Dioscorea alata]KAH7667633.1 tRNA pseudouridine(32) synthase protein [Dioscorea alata]